MLRRRSHQALTPWRRLAAWAVTSPVAFLLAALIDLAVLFGASLWRRWREG